LEEDGGAPFGDGPVRCFEVGFAGDAAQGGEVLGGQEERVLVLVFVDEEGGGEGKVGVQCAGWEWGLEGLGCVGKSYLEGRM
jgi:hypothetical protein